METLKRYVTKVNIVDLNVLLHGRQTLDYCQYKIIIESVEVLKVDLPALIYGTL